MNRFTSSTTPSARDLSARAQRGAAPGVWAGLPGATPPAARQAGKLPTPPSGELRCFVVEDSPVIRENLIATLEEMLPLKVVGTADDEEGALRWLRSGRADCDLVIIDIFLKTGSGLGVLREARAQFPQRRLIVLSNYATPDMRRRCHELGADRVFDKSSELDELIGYCDELSRAQPS